MRTFLPFEHFGAAFFRGESSIASRERPGRIGPAGKARFWIGLILLSAFFAQTGLGWYWGWLAEQQTHEMHKQMTGLLLVLFIGHQCWLSLQRTRGEPGAARHALARHKRWGTIAPLLFYVHSVRLGHAYLFALSLSFFAVFALGLLHQQLLNLQKKWLNQAWLIAHVALSTVLLILLGYHVYVSFAYE
ncbi:MAG TPA: hypothetical protein VNL74_04880 [Methylococcus sp.]|nr:hypothetical protein [Methylococcus sp.]